MTPTTNTLPYPRYHSCIILVVDCITLVSLLLPCVPNTFRKKLLVGAVASRRPRRPEVKEEWQAACCAHGSCDRTVQANSTAGEMHTPDTHVLRQQRLPGKLDSLSSVPLLSSTGGRAAQRSAYSRQVVFHYVFGFLWCRAAGVTSVYSATVGPWGQGGLQTLAGLW